MIPIIKQISQAKRSILVLLLPGCILSIVYALNTKALLSEFCIPNAFDLISSPTGDGIIGKLALVTFIIPTFVIIVLQINQNSSLFYKIRLRTRFSIWNNKLYVTIIISLIYSFIFVICSYFICSLFLYNFNCTWSESQSSVDIIRNSLMQNTQETISIIECNIFKIMFMIFITFLLGLILIGLLTNLLKLFTKHNIIVFIIVFLLITAEVILKINIPIIVGKMSFSFNFLIDNGNFLHNILTLIISITICYIGGFVIEKKEEYI